MKKAGAAVVKVFMSEHYKIEKYVCWNCKETLIGTVPLFCSACEKIQPPFPVDHFTRLGLPRSFDQGMHALEKVYFMLQNQLHPDRFIKKDDTERKLSLQQTISVNESYEIVKSPLKRAEYLLSLQGITVNKDGAGVKPSQSLLEESLESRAALEEAGNVDEVHAMAVKTAEQRMQCMDDIRDGFLQGDLQGVAQLTIRLRYLEKLNEEIKAKQHRLTNGT